MANKFVIILTAYAIPENEVSRFKKKRIAKQECNRLNRLCGLYSTESYYVRKEK